MPGKGKQLLLPKQLQTRLRPHLWQSPSQHHPRRKLKWNKILSSILPLYKSQCQMQLTVMSQLQQWQHQGRAVHLQGQTC